MRASTANVAPHRRDFASARGDLMQLPLIITAAQAFVALYPCRLNPIRAIIAPPLEPVSLRGKRGIMSVSIVDCDQSSIGPFKLVTVALACRLRPWFSPPIGGLFLERRVTDFGYWVCLTASNHEALSQGNQTHWAHPSFLADVNVQMKRSKARIVVSEHDGAEVLRFEMKRPGSSMPLHFPLRHYSRQDAEILRVEADVNAVGCEKSFLARSHVAFNRHERVDPLRILDVEGGHPLQVRWYDSYRTSIGEPAARFLTK